MATDNPPGLDYRQLGLICGIEIHQQLDTACKLFCGCPTAHREVEDSNFEFFRYLRPSRSELGEIDRAALEEVLVSRKFHYKCYDTTCLVEADEEPPSQINPEALEISLVIARLLSMQIVDEVCTMRKMVIDGSNTSGFQRTAYIGSKRGSSRTGETAWSTPSIAWAFLWWRLGRRLISSLLLMPGRWPLTWA